MLWPRARCGRAGERAGKGLRLEVEREESLSRPRAPFIPTDLVPSEFGPDATLPTRK